MSRGKHRRGRAELGIDLLIGQHLGLRRFGAACRTSELSPFLAVDDLDRPDAHELLTGGANPNGRRIRHWRLPLLLVKARDRYRKLSATDATVCSISGRYPVIAVVPYYHLQSGTFFYGLDMGGAPDVYRLPKIRLLSGRGSKRRPATSIVEREHAWNWQWIF